MITGFSVLAIFYVAYRLNRDEGVILALENRVKELEKQIESLSSES